MPDIGKRIKAKRIELGMTQEDLANKLYLVQNRVRAAQRSKTHQNGRSM